MLARSSLALFYGLVLIACALASGAARAQGAPVSGVPHITITGRAHVEVVPDIATLAVAVITEKPKAADAESANATAVQALIQDVKAQGIDARDIKTVSLTLAPVYSEQRDLVRQVSNRVLRGYRARNAIAIKVRDLDKVSVLAGQLIGKGANEFYGVHFDYTHEQEAYDKLRGEAMEDALRQAKAYLAPVDLHLGRVLEIAPFGNASPQNFRFTGSGNLRTLETVDIPVAPGTLTLETQVQVTWELSP